jgi:hypothetical protein
MKTCHENPNLVKIGRKYAPLYMKTNICFIVTNIKFALNSMLSNTQYLHIVEGHVAQQYIQDELLHFQCNNS